MTDRPTCEPFNEVALLAGALGITDINGLAGCWEHQVDEQWWIAVNGHDAMVRCSKGARVEPFGCYIEFNGWPAGTMNPFGGIIAAGEAANEDSFIEALKAARERSAP